MSASPLSLPYARHASRCPHRHDANPDHHPLPCSMTCSPKLKDFKIRGGQVVRD
jgi:hypothetical protein